MSQDAGTLTVTIALMGADEFDTQAQQVTQDLQSIQTAAETASGEQGIGGLGSASDTAGTSMTGLGTSTGGLSTAVGALGGALSGTIGGMVSMQQSGFELESLHDRLGRAVTANEKATNTYESTLAKYGGTADSAGKSTAELQSATEKLQSANDKVHKDYENIQADEDRINSLRREGKTNTEEYQRAVQKLADDTNTLKEDQGKAVTAQQGVNQAHQDFAQKVAGPSAEGAAKIKAAFDHMNDTSETVARIQKEINLETTKQWLSTAQTILGAVGSISAAIGTFGRLFRETKTVTDEFGNSGTTIGTNWGKLIGTGGVLTLAGIAIYAIANNVGGVRTAMEQWWSTISSGNPLLEGLGHLIHGIAADLGLTGTGPMSGNNEISAALRDIKAAFESTNIGKDIEDLIGKFAAFIRDPFGSTGTTWSISKTPQKIFAPGIGKDIVTNVTQQQEDNATLFANAILKVLEDGLVLVGKGIAAAATALGGQIASYIISGIQDQTKNVSLTGPGGAPAPLTMGPLPGAKPGLFGMPGVGTNFPALGGEPGATPGQGGFTLFGNAPGWSLFGNQTGATQFQTQAVALGKTIGEGIKTGISQVTDILKPIADAFNTLKTTAKGAWDGIVATARSTLGVLQELFKPLGQVWDQMKTAATTAWNTIKTTVQTAITAIEGFFKPLANVWDAIKTAATTAWNAIKTIATTVIKAIEDPINALKTVWDAIKTAATTAWNAIKTAVTAIIADIQKGLDALKNVWDAIKSAATTAWNAIKTAVTTVITGIQTALDGLKSAWDAIKQAADTAWNAIKSTVTGVISAISTALLPLKTIWNEISTAATTAWSAIRSAATGVISAITGALAPLRTIWNEISGAASTAWNAIKSTAAGVISSIQSGIASLGAGAWNAVQTAAQTVANAIQAAFSAVIQLIVNALNGLLATAKSIPGVSVLVQNVPPFTNPLAAASPAGGGPIGLTPRLGQPGSIPGTVVPRTFATAGGPIVVNLVVSGKQLAQAVAPFNTGTSQFA